MLLNIANAGKFPIEEDAVRLAKKAGLVQEGELKLALSALNAGGFKYEPVFVFKKL